MHFKSIKCLPLVPKARGALSPRAEAGSFAYRNRRAQTLKAIENLCSDVPLFYENI